MKSEPQPKLEGAREGAMSPSARCSLAECAAYGSSVCMIHLTPYELGQEQPAAQPPAENHLQYFGDPPALASLGS
jgi:hypothetical protein